MVYDNKDNVADIVFIWDYQYKYNTDDTYFKVANWTKYRTYDNDGEYVMRDVYVDGAAQKMELAADADAEIVTVDGNGNKNGGAGNGLYQVVKMDGDRVVEIEPVDADANSAGIQSAANTYYVDKGDKGSKSFELTKAADDAYFGRYTWDDDTIFVTATQDGSNWKVSDGSSSDIWELEDGNTANVDEGDKYSYVYVAKANSKDEAELVYIFNYTKGAVVKIDFDMDVPSNISTIKVNDTLVTGTDISIAKGKDAVVEITAGTNCEVTKVLVNGDEVKVREKNGVYTFTIDNVKKDTDVEVFTKNNGAVVLNDSHVYENGAAVAPADEAIVFVNDVADGSVTYGEKAVILVQGANVKGVTVNGAAAKKTTSGDFTATVNKATALDVVVTYFDVAEKATLTFDLTEIQYVEINGKIYMDGDTFVAEAGTVVKGTIAPSDNVAAQNLTLSNKSVSGAGNSITVNEPNFTIVAQASGTVTLGYDHDTFSVSITAPAAGWDQSDIPATAKGGSQFKYTLTQQRPGTRNSADVELTGLADENYSAVVTAVGRYAADAQYTPKTYTKVSEFMADVDSGMLYKDNQVDEANGTKATYDDYATSMTFYLLTSGKVEAQKCVVEITVTMPDRDVDVTVTTVR